MRIKKYIISILLLSVAIPKTYVFATYNMQNDFETQGARTVPHLTFSGVPDAEPGSCGTGIDGDVWDGQRYYLADGRMATECFFCDGVYTYYLQNDGTPMKDRLTYHPDGEHIIYFDENGYEVFSDDRIVTESITGDPINNHYYFDVNGFMFIDKLAFLSNSDIPVYYDYAGMRVEAGQYVLPDGNMVIALNDGKLIYNKFSYDAFGRIVYCNWDGTLAKGTISDGNFSYEMDEKEGYLKSYRRLSNSASGAVPFESLKLYVDMGINQGANLYDMRVIGDNKITNSISNWYGCDTIVTYMDNLYDDQYWRLEIYKNENGDIIDSITESKGEYFTLRGVGIGTDRETVKNAYGMPEFSGENYDWYGINTTLGGKYAYNWMDNYKRVQYGIRFCYDNQGKVSKLVYQRYPLLNADKLAEIIKNDITDISPYYAKRDFLSYRYDENQRVILDAALSKYSADGCSYEWYDLNNSGGEIDTKINAKIKGENSSSFILDSEKYPAGVYCRITTTEGIFDVFFRNNN